MIVKTRKLTKGNTQAIAWFCDKNSLKPALSVPPFQMNFTDKTTGLDKTCHLDLITLQYGEHKKEEAKRRKREYESKDR